LSVIALLRQTLGIAEWALTNRRFVLREMRIQGRRVHAPEEGTFRNVQAAAATRGTVIENGLWCSKTRSRWLCLRTASCPKNPPLAQKPRFLGSEWKKALLNSTIAAD
jgi:hypothetical protein